MNEVGVPPHPDENGPTPALWRRVSTSWLLIGALACTLCLAVLSEPASAVFGKGFGSHHAAPFNHLRDGKPRPPDGGKGKVRGKKKSIAERVRKNFPKWRGHELNKVLREVSRRNPARGNKFLKEGLSAHEGGTHKGHTISRHVAVSPKHLEARIEYEKRRSADRKQQTRKDHTALKMDNISSFKSLKEANRLVEKTLTDPQNKGRLKNWARNKSGSKQFLELTLRDAGAVTGLAMHPKSKKLAEARGVRVVLRRSNGKRGWAIVTAHPVVKAEASKREKLAGPGKQKSGRQLANKGDTVYRNGKSSRSKDVSTAESTGAWRLVGAPKAKIDPRKLTEYALNPNHPVGGNKAKVFDSVLGFNRSNARELVRQIEKGIMNNTPVAGKVDKYGERFTVDIPVTGPKGSGVVRTGWIYKPGSTVPEMTTLFVK